MAGPRVATTSTAALCAIDSMTSTPGMTGIRAKCPWKYDSLIDTFLMPTALTSGTTSIMRSIMRNG